MNEIQRLLANTIEKLNVTEKRDNRPRFSISFIRKHPGLFIGMYIGLFATLWVMMASETLAGEAWILIVLFAILNVFSFLMLTRAIATAILTSLIFGSATTGSGITHAMCQPH